MRTKVLKFLILVSIAAVFAHAKRGGGRSRGSSSRISGWFTRKSSDNKSSRGSVPRAPPEPDIAKQTSSVQQNSRPIGWNVDNKKTNTPNQAQPPSYQQSAPVHPPAYPQQPGYPPSYQQTMGGGYPAHPPSYQQPVGGYGYGQHYPQQHHPAYGGYGAGFGGYNMGNKPGGFGGIARGLGGAGSYAAYGYGLKKSGGFFGKHAFRNVLGGLFVWYLVSGIFSRPYKVYNYYNHPENENRQEITLPANVLTLCNENATDICVPGTTGICTQDGKILCVTTMNTVTPCRDSNGELCVSSTVPCLSPDDPLCRNSTVVNNTATVNMPCFTNMTITQGDVVPPNITLPVVPGQDNKYCVTTMALPDSELPVENSENFNPNAPLTSTTAEGLTTSNSTNTTN